MNTQKLEERFWQFVTPDLVTVCWLWQGGTDGDEGYGRLHTSGKKYIYAHRLSYQLHHGTLPNDLDILHRCDNRRCVNPYHLYAGTHADNMADMKARKRYVISGVRGEANGQSKLTTTDVIEIRAMSEHGVTQKDIAQRFGVPQSSVSKIIRRKQWAHIP